MAVDDTPVRVWASTATPYGTHPEATCGRLETLGGAVLPFTLRWRMHLGKPVLLEVLPYEKAIEDHFPPLRLPSCLAGDVPLPLAELDDVAAKLWAAVGFVGLPLVVRCLASWWRVQDELLPAGHAAESVAAAVLAGSQREGACTRWLAAPAVRGQAAADVRRVLGLSAEHPW